MNRGKGAGEAPAKKIISQNRKARFEYHILETIEAGIVLTGAEIKSIRGGGITIAESYVRPFNDGAMWLIGAHIKPYQFSPDPTYDPIRPRKLLLHAAEIEKLRGRIEKKGLTLVALEVYLLKGKAKIEIALAKGKDAPDKRDTVKDRDAKRELQRVLKRG